MSLGVSKLKLKYIYVHSGTVAGNDVANILCNKQMKSKLVEQFNCWFRPMSSDFKFYT